MMLKERDVIKYVCNHLEGQGFSITKTCNENERGPDIDAIHPGDGQRVLIEAKGETSSKPYTKRYGLTFTKNQVYDHVAKAFYVAVVSKNRDPNFHIGIALPKNDHHLEQVRNIDAVLAKLEVEVFWVTATGEVEIANNWLTWQTLPPPSATTGQR